MDKQIPGYSPLPDSAAFASRMSQLNIAIISDAAPGRNGVGTFYEDLKNHLEPCVNRIEILSPTLNGDKWEAGLVLPLPGDKTQKLCVPNPFTLKRQLNAVNADIVIIATPGVYGILGAMLASFMDIPAIAGFHTSFEKITELYWQNSTAGLIVHGYFKISNYYLFRKCPLVVANSREMIAQAEAIGAQRTMLVSTPLSSMFCDRPLREYTGKLERVIFAGRLAPEKNIETVFDAARRLPDIQFTIVGDGPKRELVEHHTTRLQNLTYLGWLDREALCEQIDQHDALVLPSYFESFGTIALEAMARKRLVVVSSDCGIADWQDYQAGLYVMADSGLANCLEKIVNLSDAERIQKAEQALVIAESVNKRNLALWCGLLLNELT